MKEIADRHMTGNDYCIEVVDNGYILKYYCAGDRTRIITSFTDLVNTLAQKMGLLGWREEITVEKLKKEPEEDEKETDQAGDSEDLA